MPCHATSSSQSLYFTIYLIAQVYQILRMRSHSLNQTLPLATSAKVAIALTIFYSARG
ncbi:MULTISPECIES: hypothetical protein [Kamptonema]|uniref:hypothetical protein n=1 Tax=Kamptonema TaxID=1501433 RepID=UPI0002E2B2F4|nr:MULTISPECIES: hypothetical protein [Kamptonema]